MDAECAYITHYLSDKLRIYIRNEFSTHKYSVYVHGITSLMNCVCILSNLYVQSAYKSQLLSVIRCIVIGLANLSSCKKSCRVFSTHLLREDDDCFDCFKINSLVPLIEGLCSPDSSSQFYVHILCFAVTEEKICSRKKSS